jgi:hypothetical protein
MDTTRTALSHLIDRAKNLASLFSRTQEAQKEEVIARYNEFNSALMAMNSGTEPDITTFIPANGRACIVREPYQANVWKVVAIADNWPHPHHPLAIGDKVIPQGYSYGHNHAGGIAFVKPTELLAVLRAQTGPVPTK